ncbi:MAG: hypothetical protein AAF748_06635 [Pseudomonadota bacterium]
MSQRPVFLQPKSYRRRRRIDALRILPLVGALALLAPLLWSQRPDGGLSTAGAGAYVFGAWAGMIVAAWVLSRGLAKASPPEARSEANAAETPGHSADALR